MSKVKLEIRVQRLARRFDYIEIDGRPFSAKTFFSYRNGRWVHKDEDYYIDEDGDIDIIVIAIGQPNNNCKMRILINDEEHSEFEMLKPFNKYGYGVFVKEIS